MSVWKSFSLITPWRAGWSICDAQEQQRIDMSSRDIRRDLEKTQGFEKTRLYARVFGLADKLAGKPTPHAALPQIRLSSPKITRNLTSEWCANHVEGRYQACLQRLTN
jgi:hypothetical protein